MTATREYDLVAIGGGTAGLVATAGAAYLGARTALVEKSALGGDCLWTGCVPSKALIASANLAHEMGHADRLGLRPATDPHDVSDVFERMRAARARVARHDDPDRIRARGIDVHFGPARFLAPDRIEVEGVGVLISKRFVIATGAGARVAPVQGLDGIPYLTYETFFDLRDLPESLLVLGAGPVGLELAQVAARLGSAVTVLEMADRVLPNEDPTASATLANALDGEGIEIRTDTRIRAFERSDCGVRAVGADGRPAEARALLVATGRTPTTQGLDLPRAGVELDGAAVRVDRRLRTTARSVWAAGDVTGGPQFTHAADAMARAALQNALLPVPTSVDYPSIPRVTYTDPEVAHVGPSHEEAQANGATLFEYAFGELDRAIVDGDTDGSVRISADRRGRVVAATIVGGGAGELLLPLVMARKHGVTLARIAQTSFPYPTRMEAVKRAADAYQRERLEGWSGRLLKRIVSWMT